VVQRLADPFDQVGAAHHGPGHQVRVAAQVLGSAVHAQIETVRQRPEVHRAGEGVVDDREQAFVAGEVGDLIQQPDPHQRVVPW
jgi:hypothetical protein